MSWKRFERRIAARYSARVDRRPGRCSNALRVQPQRRARVRLVSIFGRVVEILRRYLLAAPHLSHFRRRHALVAFAVRRRRIRNHFVETHAAVVRATHAGIVAAQIGFRVRSEIRFRRPRIRRGHREQVDRKRTLRRHRKTVGKPAADQEVDERPRVLREEPLGAIAIHEPVVVLHEHRPAGADRIHHAQPFDAVRMIECEFARDDAAPVVRDHRTLVDVQRVHEMHDVERELRAVVA